MFEANKALAHRFHMDIFQRKDPAAADQILSRDFVWHGGMGPGEGQRGPAATKPVATALSGAFPDLKITHDDVVAEGDKVLIRWTARGTHRGEFQGIAPTGKAVTVTGVDLFRIAGGKIVELWQEADRLGMMRQLGVIPQ